MIPYSFSVLRYTHDSVTGEFVNIGVAVLAEDMTYLSAKCTAQYGRITRMFDRIDGERFKQLVRNVEEGILALAKNIHQRPLPFVNFEPDLAALLARVLPPDDSAIRFSPAGFGVSADLEVDLRMLFERYVERYAGQQDTPSRSDDEVWRVFRENLEGRDVLPHLAPKRIVAPDFEYEFKAAWKNSVWHVYEPLSFDLVEPNSIVDKANRWLGRAANLAESLEPFALHLLIGRPRDSKLGPVFNKACNILNKIQLRPELVFEEEALAFAADLQREISLHQSPQGLLPTN
jgi:hypothetical protein